ncbi:MAG: hypothetical protein WCZ17_11860 [Candidatus Kapaibacterium sp.]
MNTIHNEELNQSATKKNNAIIENRIDWEDAVYNELCDQGEMDRTDAQGIVEAIKIQGQNILDYAWNNNINAAVIATLILLN